MSTVSDRAALENEALGEERNDDPIDDPIPPTQNSPVEDLPLQDFHLEDSQDPNELPSSDLFSPEDKALPYVPPEEEAPVKTHVFGETSPESGTHGSHYDELVYDEGPTPVKDDHDKVELKKAIAKLRKQKSALIPGFEFTIFRKLSPFVFPHSHFKGNILYLTRTFKHSHLAWGITYTSCKDGTPASEEEAFRD